MRCSLPLAGPESRFQFPAQAFTLLFEAFTLLFEPFVLFLEPADLPLGPVQLLSRNKFDRVGCLTRFPSARCSHPPYSSRTRSVCPANSFNSPYSRASQPGKQIQIKLLLPYRKVLIVF